MHLVNLGKSKHAPIRYLVEETPANGIRWRCILMRASCNNSAYTYQKGAACSEILLLPLDPPKMPDGRLLLDGFGTHTLLVPIKQKSGYNTASFRLTPNQSKERIFGRVHRLLRPPGHTTRSPSQETRPFAPRIIESHKFLPYA